MSTTKSTPRRIYVASSWRNPAQPHVVTTLRAEGHEVYDFRNPAPGEDGFSWSEIDPAWQSWTPEQYRAALAHPIAVHGRKRDQDALDAADATVLVMPCGRSASWEAAYALGRGQRVIILLAPQEPELMYGMVPGEHLCTTLDEVIAALAAPPRAVSTSRPGITVDVDGQRFSVECSRGVMRTLAEHMYEVGALKITIETVP